MARSLLIAYDSNQLKDDHGIVLVLLASFMFVIFVFAALAIDLTQLYSAGQQGSNAAKFTALSALKGYTSAPSSSSRDAKLAAALAAARDAATKNLVLTIGGKQDAESPTDVAGSSPLQLVAGKYYATAPPGNQSCANPCLVGETTPCFVPLENANPSCEPAGIIEMQPNAFRVRGTYFADVRSIFARVMNAGTNSIHVDETATMVPRRGIFLVDISDSMYRETHSPKNASPSYFEYYLSQDNGTTPLPDYNASWAALPASRANASGAAPRPGDPEYPKTHYKSDYLLPALLTDSDFADPVRHYDDHHPSPTTSLSGSDYSARNMSGIYRVDSYRDASYSGPEPFTTVMAGLNAAVTQFKSRAVVGDKLGIVFFDKQVSWPRVLTLSADFDYIQRFTDLSATNDPDRGFSLLMRHGIFPSNDNKSNLMLAVTEAMRQFSEEQKSDITSVQFMAYFGDGLANCASNLPQDLIRSSGYCNDNYVYYRQAIRELTDFALGTLNPQKIPLHVVLVGGHVGPHRLAIQNAAGTGCLSDTDARNAKTDLVRGQTFSSDADGLLAFWNASDATPFYQANYDLYRIARITGGVWAPMMAVTSDPLLCNPPCTESDPFRAPRTLYSCQDAKSQVESYIDQILGSQPFMIVPTRR